MRFRNIILELRLPVSVERYGMPSQNRNGREQRRRHPRILIADDEELVRTGVATVVSRDGKYAICGMADDERRTTELVERTQPELLLLDLFLGHRDGLALIKDLAIRVPKMRILVLSDRDEHTYAQRALDAGASGYMMKNASAEQLLRAIESVLEGKIYLSDRCRLRAQLPLERRHHAKDSVGKLTDRELHVFRLIGTGLGTGRIAQELGLSRKTIETYREHIKLKLGYVDGQVLIKSAVVWCRRAQK
jgi:DNA-binding NarL/FixJ family response regulator